MYTFGVAAPQPREDSGTLPLGEEAAWAQLLGELRKQRSHVRLPALEVEAGRWSLKLTVVYRTSLRSVWTVSDLVLRHTKQ